MYPYYTPLSLFRAVVHDCLALPWDEMTSYLNSDSLMASLNSFSVNTGSCEHPFIAQVELVPEFRE